MGDWKSKLVLYDPRNDAFKLVFFFFKKKDKNLNLICYIVDVIEKDKFSLL